MAIARALVPRALERQPLADIEAMLRDLLVRLESQPRMILALPPALLDVGQQTLGAIVARGRLRGRIVDRAGSALGPGDARLAWRGGRAERDLVELERAATAWSTPLPATAAEPWPIDHEEACMNGATHERQGQARAAGSCASHDAARQRYRCGSRGPTAAGACAPSSDKPPAARGSDDLEAVYDIPVQVSAVLGKATMQVSQLLKLGRGAVVELDRKVGEAIDIYVNNRLVARGEVVIVDDRLGVTMTEIIKTEP